MNKVLIGLILVILLVGCTGVSQFSSIDGFYSALKENNITKMKSYFDSEYVGNQVELNMPFINESLGDFESYKLEGELTAEEASLFFFSYTPYFNSGEWVGYKINGTYENGESVEIIAVDIESGMITQWVVVGGGEPSETSDSLGNNSPNENLKEEKVIYCKDYLSEIEIESECGVDFEVENIESDILEGIDKTTCYIEYDLVSPELSLSASIESPAENMAGSVFSERKSLSTKNIDEEFKISDFDAYSTVPTYGEGYVITILVNEQLLKVQVVVKEGTFDDNPCSKDEMKSLAGKVIENI